MRLFFLIGVLTLSALVFPAAAQPGAGAKFGGRDPRPCTARKDPANGAPAAEQAKKIVLCDDEKITSSVASGQLLYLITGLTVEVGKGRPFQMRTDAWPDIDPSQMVYPIRGSYTQWQCGSLDRSGAVRGHNCNKLEQPSASGILYKDTFGDWHSKFMDSNHSQISNACPGAGGAPECLLPPPTGN